jgi:hypothetical protein
MQVNKILSTLIVIGVLSLTGCSVPSTKQTIDLKCENGVVTFSWWIADVLDENTDIRNPRNLKKSGFYTDDNGKYMKCIEENK